MLPTRTYSDPEAHVSRMLAAPLAEVGNAFESLTRLRKLKHRVVVVDLMSAVHVRARVLKVPPHLVEQNRLIDHRNLPDSPVKVCLRSQAVQPPDPSVEARATVHDLYQRAAQGRGGLRSYSR